MKRVTGIAGVMFQAQDAITLRRWYRERLGIDVQPWGGAAFDVTNDATGSTSTTVSSVVERESKLLTPGTAPFMVTYRVEDLRALVQVLNVEGCQVTGDADATELGRFAWLVDPEGNKVELWESPGGK